MNGDKKTQRKQSGFTLIEIAIVLVIIGLLLGGVLKGQELINSAKVKNLAQDFKNIPVYLYGFQDKFRTLPGDDGAIATHVAGGTVCTPAAANKCTVNNGVIDGAWNATTVADESFVFWQHVRLAGFMTGPTDTTATDYIPTNAAGGITGIQSNNANFTTITKNAAGVASPMIGGYVICSTGILGKFVKQLDATIDNGDTNTGSMRVADPAVAGESIAVADVSDGTSYTVCMGI